MKKFLAFVLALAMLLSLAACGGGSTNGGTSETSSTNEGSSSEDGISVAPASEINIDTSEGAIQDLVTYETTNREVESLNVLYSQQATDFYVSTNLFDGLLSNDSEGNLIPGLAESWETTDNGLTWTFHLREGLTWVDVNGEVKASLTSADFVTGLEWVLNVAKNDNANTSMPNDMIEGAKEYNEKTQELVDAGSTEEALALTTEDFLDIVGIEAPDELTVVYHCTTALPYFDTVATYACLYPASAALIEEVGVDGFRACTNDNMWYSGPYLLTEYIQGNEKVFEPNPYWWGNEENTRFNSVTVKMVDDLNVAYQLYTTGEIDEVTLTESAVSTIVSNGGEEYEKMVEGIPSKYSYQMHFCYDKNNEDGTPDVNWNTAVANDAFRLSWYYGLDLTDFYSRTNSVNPLKLENNCYTASNLVFTSDGTDYTDLVKQNLGLGEYNGETMVRLDTDKAAQYKAQAMEELTALGVTFPVEVDYYISSSSQTALDSANMLAKCFSESLGDDFVKLNICTYVSSLSKEVRAPRLASIYINGWGADYGDPQNFLFQETIGDENAYYSAVYSCINDFYGEKATSEPYSEELISEYETFTEMVAEANAINDDMDARYAAYAEAEAYMIQHCLAGIPCYIEITLMETRVNEYSKIYSPYGMQMRRYLNWETNSNGYTAEEYAAFAAE